MIDKDGLSTLIVINIIDATSISSYPNSAFMILKNTINIIVAQTVYIILAIIKTRQSKPVTYFLGAHQPAPLHSNPDNSFFILSHKVSYTFYLSSTLRYCSGLSKISYIFTKRIIYTQCTIFKSYPKVSVIVFEYGTSFIAQRFVIVRIRNT